MFLGRLQSRRSRLPSCCLLRSSSDYSSINQVLQLHEKMYHAPMKIDQPVISAAVQTDLISEDQAGQRIDNYLLTRLKGAPRTLIYRILRKGEVRVNKGRIKPEYRLRAGDSIRIPPVRLPQPDEPALVGQGILNALESNILYEDKGLIVVNKPAGLAVHGGSGLDFGVIEAMRQLRPELQQLELVHRLDRDTSGCLMIAKKRSMLRHLHAELRGDGPGKGVTKCYLALVRGRWPSTVKKVHAPLLKNNLRSGERMVEVNPEGKESLTEFRVIQRFGDFATLVEARPITGRTHQIRVHARHAGHPIAGDPKYGDDDFSRIIREKGGKRLFLHAVSLSAELPEGGRLEVSAEPGTVWDRTLSRLSEE
ncbi:ribosomal large subunit pseudouridine synthase C [Halopseudomonas bauzanensis]|uniref:Pseudouridine synthase n=2 Tax=Halopseudomonas bauzanensis TaxID=653930 RepID=A0A1I4IWU0_9GAMM|nr:ribosomal large subunit pseudouridine synthase C [Halopseudomonas bauzanensis]SFL58838.1 23S rRNA pseudouridine955/2504/2580 synthase [Halopseudomonas bauzanensis]